MVTWRKSKSKRSKRRVRRPKPAAPPQAPQGFERRGRKSVLTPELQREICGKIATGDSLRDAVITSGASESSVHEWIARGRGTDPDRANKELFANFADAIRQAEATRRRLFKGVLRSPKEERMRSRLWSRVKARL